MNEQKQQLKRAVIYTRISTDNQVEGTSLAAQYVACCRKAEELGYEIVEHVEEVISGGLYLARPGIQRVIGLIEAGQAEVLLSYQLDRAGRDVDALRSIRRRVEKAGGHLVFANGLEVQGGAVGHLMFTQLGAFAEFERETIRERTVRGTRAKAQAGLQMGRGYNAFGYYVIRKADVLKGTHPAGSEGTYIVVESEARQIPVIYENYVRLRSLRALAAWLNEQGYRKRDGGLWLPNGLAQIITSRIYKGEAGYGKRRRRVDESRVGQGKDMEYYVAVPEEEWTPLSAPPLVSAQLWEEANRIMRTGRDERSGPRQKRYLLTGLVFCPRCGHKMYALKQRSRSDEAPRGHRFRCGQTHPYTPGHPLRCAKTSYRGLAMETLVIDALAYQLSHPALVTAAQRVYRNSQSHKEAKRSATDEAARLQREVERLEKREAAAAAQAVEARIAGSDGLAYEKLRAEAEAQRRQLETRLQAVQEQRSRQEPPQLSIEPQAAQQIITALRSEETSVADKAALLSRRIEKIYPLSIEGTPVAHRNAFVA